LGDDGTPLPLASPSLEFCAKLNGGELEYPGVPAEEYSPQAQEFLFHYGRSVLHMKRNHPGQSRELDKIKSRQCEHGKIAVGANHDGYRDVTVSYGGKRMMAAMPDQGGVWLEEIATVAFQRAGAEELRTSVVWKWPRGVLQGASGQPRCEADVLARFGHRYLAVECKAGITVTTSKASKSIEAVALAGLGRFGIPVVVRPIIYPEMMRDSFESKSSAVLLDLAVLLDTDQLRRILQKVFLTRSTFDAEG
jgi:hypothetical protein